MPDLKLPEVTLNFDDRPATGPQRWNIDAIVLVHGWACDSTDWDALLPRLAPLTRVVTHDLRGHGKSGDSEGNYAPTDMGGDLLALLNHLHLARVVLVGHSAGAEVAATVAVEHPERVSALVCLDPAYGSDPTERQRLEQVSASFAGPDAANVVPTYFTGIIEPANLAAGHQLLARAARPQISRRMFNAFNLGERSWHFLPETADFLKKRDTPLLAVYRSEQRAAIAREFTNRPADRVLDYHSGHWPHLERPDRFVADLDAWLSSLPSDDETHP